MNPTFMESSSAGSILQLRGEVLCGGDSPCWSRGVGLQTRERVLPAAVVVAR
jgi:hypothetical protein